MNIIQAEFFYHFVDTDTSLRKLLTECFERAHDAYELAQRGIEAQNGIKTVVRFFDTTGEMTALVKNAERIRELDKKNAEAKPFSSGARRWVLEFLTGRLAQKKADLRAELLRRTCEQIKRSKALALETSGHKFRMVRKDEAHEIRESISRAKNVWVFVYEYNNLLADNNKLVTSVM